MSHIEKTYGSCPHSGDRALSVQAGPSSSSSGERPRLGAESHPSTGTCRESVGLGRWPVGTVNMVMLDSLSRTRGAGPGRRRVPRGPARITCCRTTSGRKTQRRLANRRGGIVRLYAHAQQLGSRTSGFRLQPRRHYLPGRLPLDAGPGEGRFPVLREDSSRRGGLLLDKWYSPVERRVPHRFRRDRVEAGPRRRASPALRSGT